MTQIKFDVFEDEGALNLIKNLQDTTGGCLDKLWNFSFGNLPFLFSFVCSTITLSFSFGSVKISGVVFFFFFNPGILTLL